MKFIGITGGVGSGKSMVLRYLSEKQNVRVLLADEVAHDLMNPGTDCYYKICTLFKDINLTDNNGYFNKDILSKFIFSNNDNRLALNNVVHPAVKDYVINEVNKEIENGNIEFFIFEAALLIEEGYDKICDELWYIYTSEEKRRERLIKSRGYSEEKIQQIFSSQLDEQTYRNHCIRVIDNNGSAIETYHQIDKIFEDYLKNKKRIASK